MHIESIPENWREWGVKITNASALADVLNREHNKALLFRALATLRTDVTLFDDVEQLRSNGPTAGFDAVPARLDAARMESREGSRERTPPRKSSSDTLA